MGAPEYPIETERLLLRPFERDDFEALLAIRSRPDVVRYLYGDPSDAEEVRRSLADRVNRRWLEAEGEILFLAAILRRSEELIGDVSLRWLSREHRQGEVGFVFHPDHHGRGLATEAAEPMLALGFERLGLHRIIGRLDSRNLASARVLERLGMRREAHFVENEFVKGAWCDELVYAMLAAEWRASGRTGSVARRS
jgi:RimJ/RimL family protein N-acetyltransferase